MANVETKHETVLDAGTTRSRLARVYAQALMVASEQKSPQTADDIGAELTEFVRAVTGDANVGAFLASPAVGKKKKTAALVAALQQHGSELLRGLVGTLANNNRLDLLRGVAAAFRGLLDDRAGRVRVKVTAAVPLSDAQRVALTANMKNVLGNQEPVLDVRVDPDLLGGLVVQVGDAVIDTSVRSRLQSLRTLLLEKGTSNG